MTFNDILEAIEKMPLDDQETLIDMVRRRIDSVRRPQIARRRAQIAKQIATVRRQFRAGKAKVATPAQIMRELMSTGSKRSR